MSAFSSDDAAEIAAHGLDVAEVERQLALFATPPGPTPLVRACTASDGIRVLTEAEIAQCLLDYEEAARAGRLTKFVPASGAASRMFKALAWFTGQPKPHSRAAAAAAAARGDSQAAEVLRFADGLPRFAFFDDLARVVQRHGGDAVRDAAAGELGPILAALLGADGLDYARLPKGILQFHRYPDGARTAFEEHLVEGAGHVRDAAGTTRLHFTVSPEHRALFDNLLGRVAPRIEARLGVRFVVGFSVQEPGTDTIAVDLENRPFRTSDGHLLFRPGGHGALLRNLQALDGDVVFLKNIDNIVPDRLRGPTLRWKQTLAGMLVGVQTRVFAAVADLQRGDLSAARLKAIDTLARTDLGLALPAGAPDRGRLLRVLDRPIRVCGVVRNTGEPGGGPFWVGGTDGTVTRQIVEGAQVDPASPEQQQIYAAASHFNPADLVCGVRDFEGRPFDLARHVDPTAVFISEKSHEGRALKALERPGLWNGAMADWISLFVEVPVTTFNPVKTVNDLLRPEHQ